MMTLVWVPDTLALKFPRAPLAWGWQWAFPSTTTSIDPRSGALRRHHLNEASVQKALSGAARRAKIIKPCSPHVLRAAALVRDPLAALLQSGYDIRTVEELLGHSDVSTTMIYERPRVGMKLDLRHVRSRVPPGELPPYS